MELLNILSFIFIVIAFVCASLFPFWMIVIWIRNERQFKETVIILLWLILITLLAMAGMIITY